MPNRKSEMTDEQKAKVVSGVVAQVVDIFSNVFYHVFEEDADLAFSKGGCESLAIILKELFPEGEILYSSNHAVFSAFGMDFDINGAHPKSNFTSAGAAGFYPISEWTKREFAPIIGYSIARARQRWPYFWDDTDSFDKTAEIENGPFLEYPSYCKTVENNKSSHRGQ